MDAASERSLLRSQCLQRRLALSGTVVARNSALICDHLRKHFPGLAQQTVGFCWPIHNEPDLRPLMLEWMRLHPNEFKPLLPAVLDRNAPLGFRAWRPEEALAEDICGIPAPARGELLTPEALLIPVNAFDAKGYRLGYGGGYFDRSLAELGDSVLRIGVGFELARVASIHPEAHDQPLDAIVTEAGVLSFDRR